MAKNSRRSGIRRIVREELQEIDKEINSAKDDFERLVRAWNRSDPSMRVIRLNAQKLINRMQSISDSAGEIQRRRETIEERE